MEASYCRFLRPSVCSQSAFLQKNGTAKFEKMGNVYSEMRKTGINQQEERQTGEENLNLVEFEGEMLIS